jgi:hypothetical protein
MWWALGNAKTGKNLAFLTPVIELLYQLHLLPHNKSGAVVVCPTRDVAFRYDNDYLDKSCCMILLDDDRWLISVNSGAIHHTTLVKTMHDFITTISY